MQSMDQVKTYPWDPIRFTTDIYKAYSPEVASIVGDIVRFKADTLSMGSENAELNRTACCIYLVWFLLFHSDKRVVVGSTPDKAKTLLIEMDGMIRRAMDAMGLSDKYTILRKTDTFIHLENNSEIYAKNLFNLTDFHQSIDILLVDDLAGIDAINHKWVEASFPKVLYLAHIHGTVLLPSDNKEMWEPNYTKYINSLHEYDRPGKAEFNKIQADIYKCDRELIQVIDRRIKLEKQRQDIAYRFGLPCEPDDFISSITTAYMDKPAVDAVMQEVTRLTECKE